MHRMILAGLITLLAPGAPNVLVAQPPARARLGGGVERDRQPPDRAALEQRFKQRLASVVQRQLGLTDDQTRRLSDVNQKYETRRMELVRSERDARVGMRRELMESTTPNEERIGQLLQEVSRIQHERLDLVDAEQADLSKFLTATQRARYLGLQEQMRRRIEEFRDRPQFMDDQGANGRGIGGRRGRRPPPPL